tara:strand:+ start:207 stop:1637 length:1431 start_codon:yes stop_codon:yes gene_type:complete
MALSPLFGEITPTAQKQLSNQSYLDFTSGAGNDFSQQYLPEIYEAEVERYGNRTLSGFLQMVGAEMPMTSDQVIWSEQNRLHISYDKCTIGANNNGTVVIQDHDNSVAAGKPHAIRVQSLIVIIDPATSTEQKAIVSAATATQITAHPFGSATWAAALVSAAHLKVFVYGSEFKKGTAGMDGSVEPSFTQFNNSPIIIKDKYGINGSDTAQIGWVEVATEDGTSGYLWYLKAESETRLRYQDYLEMAMVESEKATVTTGIAAGSTAGGAKGTEGLFSAITTRGNVFSSFTASLADFDSILKNLDGQGAIEENMLFLDRATNLAFDDMLAGLSSGAQGGTAYGLFENSQEMALNLGFTGFRRGSYDFYKTDWKYLNDASTRGNDDQYTGSEVDAIDGVLIPAGTSTVYDQILGTNIRRPFLHVRYRASEADDRRMKTWITGSVGGAFTTDVDEMNIHFLSERCLCVQGANNFVLLKA